MKSQGSVIKMNRQYFFIKGDFFKWYQAYRKSKVFIESYRYNYSQERKNELKDQYEEALEIVEEYKIFMCSISESDKSFFKESIKNKWFNYDEMNNHQDIIQNWEMIVLNSNKHSVIELDKIIVGKKLKNLEKLNVNSEQK